MKLTFAVYLAGPIDYRGGSEFSSKKKIKQSLYNTGEIAVFDPEEAWHTCSAPTPSLMKINLRVVAQCDGLLAVLPRGVLTIGSVIELVHAVDHEKSVVVVGEDGWGLSYLGVSVINPTATSDPAEVLLDIMKKRQDVLLP